MRTVEKKFNFLVVIKKVCFFSYTYPKLMYKNAKLKAFNSILFKSPPVIVYVELSEKHVVSLRNCIII